MELVPNVTIIMPVRNEAGFIKHSISAVLSQDYPVDKLQIIVADGISTDGTRQIIQEYQTGHNNLQMMDNPDQIVPTGLNIALRQACGEVIIRVDGHCQVAPDYVRRCVMNLQKEGVDGVGGSVDTIGETWLAQTIAAAMSSTFGVGDSAFRTTSGRALLVDSVPFPAYTRAIIERAGLYDEELIRNQDDEYNYRLRKLGAKIFLASDIHSRYYSRSSLTSLWHQYYQYGYWKVRVLQKHPHQMRLRQFVPLAFVLTLLGFLILSFFIHSCVYILALIIGSYLVSNLLASVWTATQKGWRYLPLLPLSYVILHISYGLGFLVGLVKFINRWGDKQGKVPQFISSV